MAMVVSDNALLPESLQKAINISFLSLTISLMKGTGKNFIFRGKSPESPLWELQHHPPYMREQ
jgi:hypothetical protein